jgi:GNAT superfamily N-acetyltransferase
MLTEITYKGSMQKQNTEQTESLHQFITSWKMIGKGFPQTDQTDKPGLAVSWPDTHFPFYNALFLSETISDAEILEENIQRAAEYMRTRQHGGLLLVCLDNLSGAAKEGLEATLARAKLIPAIPMTGMAGDILPIESPGHPALHFVRVEDDATIQAFAELNCKAYNLPLETTLSVSKEHTLWKEHASGFIAYEGDRAVATATAIINDGCVFLFLVATLPEAQRNGYGESVVRHALQTAYEATGIRRTVLHATDAGFPIYSRLGYHATAKFVGCLQAS